MNKIFIQKNIIKEKKERLFHNTNKKGSALLMAVLILGSIVAVSFSVSRMVLTAIETGGVQAQSILAYYAAESGAERFLYDLRKDSITVDDDAYNFYVDNTLPNNSEYRVFVGEYGPLKIISIGSFEATKRSVELTF